MPTAVTPRVTEQSPFPRVFSAAPHSNPPGLDLLRNKANLRRLRSPVRNEANFPATGYPYRSRNKPNLPRGRRYRTKPISSASARLGGEPYGTKPIPPRLPWDSALQAARPPLADGTKPISATPGARYGTKPISSRRVVPFARETNPISAPGPRYRTKPISSASAPRGGEPYGTKPICSLSSTSQLPCRGRIDGTKPIAPPSTQLRNKANFPGGHETSAANLRNKANLPSPFSVLAPCPP